MVKLTLCLALSAFFLFAGYMHFAITDEFAKIVPGALPFKTEIVQLTGVAEFFFAIGLLAPKWRARVGLWLSLYLLAVLPANINMALYDISVGGQDFSAAMLWGRVALQFPFIWLILYASGGLAAWRKYGVGALIKRA